MENSKAKFEIKPMPTSQRVLTWLVSYPFDKNTSKRKKIVYVTFAIAVFVIVLCGCAASVVYFWKHVATDLEKAIFALFQIVGTLNALFLVAFSFFQRHKIAAIIGKLSTIYNDRKNLYFYRILEIEIHFMTNCLFS